MRNFQFIVLLFFTSLVFSQSTTDLDNKNGFRHFKFGTSTSKIKGIDINEKQYSNNPYITSYMYNTNDIKYIVNVEIEDVKLHFFKDQLFMISLNFGDYDTKTDFSIKDYNTLLSWLEQSFGTKWLKPENSDGTITNGAIWEGDKVTLELIRINYLNSKISPEDFGYIPGYISVYDKNLNQQMYSSEF